MPIFSRFLADASPSYLFPVVYYLPDDTIFMAANKLAMRYDWRNNAVVILHNFHDRPVEITFDVGLEDAGRNLIDIADDSDSTADDKGKHHIVIEPYGYRWYRAGGLDYLLNRSEV